MTAEQIRKLPKYRLARALHNGAIPFHDVMRAYNIHPVLADTGPRVHGFVYRSGSGAYYIIVNEHLSPAIRQEILFHELHHIIEDCPQKQYVIGLDMHRHTCESKADMFYLAAAAALEDHPSG